MSNRLRILIVDNSETSAEMLRIMLYLNNYDAVSCNTAQATKDVLSVESFDLIVLDYYMDKDVTALQMLRWVRDNGIDTPVMVHSAAECSVLTTVEDAIVKERMGPYRIVRKPEDPERLLALIEEMARTPKEEQAYEVRRK